ncbi:YncE family protein [Bernardetia sp. OM2101]|uniref:YncE family protein n=1 Tax=Bernardetia sp. OM2101 TaxID=3344876 RepID=UPI0035CEC44E
MKNLVYFLRLSCFFILSLSLFSCEIDGQSPIGVDTGEPSRDYQNGFFVVNEGNFSWGKSTLTFIHQDGIDKGRVENNIFERVNNEPLGNVGQSMTIHNGKGYIVVNNSQKIEVVNPTTLEQLATIENLHSPRYFIGINDSKAYVTTIYRDLIYVIDLQTNQITNEIRTTAWTEKMAKLGDYIWVTSHDADKAWVIDSQNDEIIHTINTPEGSKWIVADEAQNRIWILAAGSDTERARLITSSLSDVRSSESRVFDEEEKPKFLSIYNNDLYWISDNNLYQISSFQVDSRLPQTPFIEGLGTVNTLIYNAVISPKNGRLLFADALDYQQEGYIFEYDLQTKREVERYKVGIIPNDICFK